MSYHAPNYPDEMLNFQIRQRDFNQCSHFLLEANSEMAFEVWFEKLELIDKRTLFLFLKKHKDEIEPEYLDMVRDRFSQPI